MSVHEGHRERLRQRFQTEGLDSFNEIQMLELLLFYAIPRKDTNLIAHGLLDHFGSVAQVLDASVEELREVPGVGENAAVFLSLIAQSYRYYLVNKAKHACALRSIEECGSYLCSFFQGRRNEMVYLLCLDAKCGVLGCKMIAEGSVNSASVPIRKVVETALTTNATAVILAHNHPSGVALPSDEDAQTTFMIAEALSMVGIQLIDHIVVADNDYVSVRQSGKYDEYLLR